MGARIPDSWFDELRSRVNIADVVSEYVPLKQKGRRHWGLCPFHSEKTPSFSVDAQAQMYYCFGCHKGGSVIHFVMELERMEFMEAITLLAERAHLPLPERTGVPVGPTRLEREQIYEANREAAQFYYATLWTPEGAEALDYLYRRGLDDADIRRFGLGSTRHASDALTRHLTEKGYGFDVLHAAGLSGEKNERRYDAFRGRVLFPIINPQGRVLGFGGRALGDGQPKYLNTADTPVFNKREGLYALNMAKKERGLKQLILVEGYMDVVSLRRQGIAGVVATLGTALTEQQARLIKRYTAEVWVCYDGDAAGQKAILRALEVLEAQDMPAQVLDIPDGMDPDDFVKAHGASAFLALKPLKPAQYRMRRAADGIDLATQEGRTQYAIDCCNILRSVKNPVELENYLSELVTQTGFAREVLISQIGAAPLTPTQKAVRPAARLRPPDTEDDWQKAEATLINLMADGLIEDGTVEEAAFITPLYRQIAQLLLAGEGRAAILDKLPDEARNDAARALGREVRIEPEKASAAAKDCLRTIYRHRLNENINEVQGALAGETDPQRVRELAQLLQDLTGELNQLKTARKE